MSAIIDVAACDAVEIRRASFYGEGRIRIYLARKRYTVRSVHLRKWVHVIDHMRIIRSLLRM